MADATAPTEPVDAEEPTPFARGATFGRYVVLGQIGAGGMGVVHAAYDPKLDRKVALKRVRAHSGRSAERRRERLLREAQALARLSHPNVVAVHDVGEHDGEVFIAMDLVEGGTVRAWLAERPRGWKEVLEVFVAAGHGLLAAHDAGLVHRDFKPDNVLRRASDGRVLVTDFGLVQVEPGPNEDSSDDGASPALTVTGAKLGTPAYMTPETYRGEPTDHRSDQFSFCVALYEALYGQRPFAAAEARPEGLASEVTHGRVQPPPRGAKVPAWLRQVVVRGLASFPEDRWPSMRELLAALERVPGRRFRLALAGIGAPVLVLGAAVVLAGRGEAPCAAAGGAAAGVWDEPARAALRQAFAASGAPVAEGTFQRVDRRLTEWTAAWGEERREACEATAVRHEQSPELLDRRIACLDRQLDGVRAKIRAFTREADADALERAVLAMPAVTELAACRDREALGSIAPPPAEPERRARLAALQARLDESEAQRARGNLIGAAESSARLVEEARELGYTPLLAAALWHRAGVLADRQEFEAADPVLLEALAANAEIRQDAAAARNVLQLIFIRATRGARVNEALGLLPIAEAYLKRAGDPPELRAQFDHQQAVALENAGRLADAQVAEERALARRRELYGPEAIELIEDYTTLGHILDDAGKPADAQRALELGLRIAEAKVGPDHPRTLALVNALGNNAYYRNDLDTALRHYQRVLTAGERAAGSTSAMVATAATNVGMIRTRKNELAEGEKWLRRGLELRVKIYGPDHPDVAVSHLNLASNLATQQRSQEALVEVGHAVTALEKRLGPTHIRLVIPLKEMAVIHLEMGQPREALPSLERALAIATAGLAPDHPDLAKVRLDLGECLLLLGRRAEAVPQLEAALAVLDKSPRPGLRARPRMLLARAFWPSARARALLDEAVTLDPRLREDPLNPARR